MNLADVIGWAGTAFTIPGFYLILTTIVRPDPKREHIAHGFYAFGSWLHFLGNVMNASLPWAVFWGLLAAYFTWLWWKNRRKGRDKKALKELGDKSRRRVQALVDQMTPSPIPSPVGGS